MAIIAFDPNATFEYILREDTAEPHTTFFLKSPDSQLAAFLFDTNVRVQANTHGPDADADIVPNIRGRQRETVRFGIADWTNLRNAAGEEIKCERISHGLRKIGPRQGLTDACLNALTPWIEELAQAIERGAILTPVDRRD